MPPANPLSLMTRWLRGPRRGRVRPQEPADLGTAFGMECWLDEARDAQPAPPPGASTSTGPRPAAWWRRSATP